MHRIRTWARQKAHGPEPLVASGRRTAVSRIRSTQSLRTVASPRPQGNGTGNNNDENKTPEEAAATATGEAEEQTLQAKPNVMVRFFVVVKDILFSSFINILLVFVPVGIASHFTNMSAGIVFSMNAIAIIPLAGLLSHATESVAKRLGDTIGALMNVTFGNAVELIIFIIALVKNEIRVVQASLVGSILANLLLILGMSFLLGGLRYREQIYNSTVTQMSACLLSLSVSSLLLPTAFHASFNNTDDADRKVLKVSRGTSVVLLLVYLLYLLFQLNSHAYMYESTPLEVIERESVPGPAANYFNSSSSSESSSSSSDSDSDQSNGTARRIKRAIKKGRNRIQRRSSSSDDNAETPGSPTLASSSRATTTATVATTATEAAKVEEKNEENHLAPDQDVPDDEGDETEAKPRHKRKHKHHKKHHKEHAQPEATSSANPTVNPSSDSQVRRVDFAMAPEIEGQTNARSKPFSLRALASPTVISKTLAVNVFNTHLQGDNSIQSGPSGASYASTARLQPQLRRTASEPADNRAFNAAPGSFPPIIPIIVNRTPKTVLAGEEGEEEDISRTTAVILLLVSTGLVALCAEFMVSSIDEVVSGDSGISEAFIGLILLPIVGNAAEHVTGVTVAMKNKMDLAIGVALGSSIQIALFVTPLVVILGWIMNKEMSLYFTLFETVAMFVSAFIVNFLVLDGRSNYLEGSLLCAAYIIIAVASFFYPDSDAANSLGGGTSEAVETAKLLIRSVANLVAR